MSVFLADRVSARLQTLMFTASHFQSLFLIEAFLLALRHGRLTLLALLAGSLVFLGKTFELQPSYGKTLARARIFLGHLALLVIERQRAFFLLLLLRAHVLQLFSQLRRILFELFQRSS